MDSTIRKGRCIIIPKELWKQALEQLHSNHMGIEKTRILACESIYWMNMNACIENIKKCSTYLDVSTQSKERIIHH